MSRSWFLVLRTANEHAVIRFDFVGLAGLKSLADFCRPVLRFCNIHAEGIDIGSINSTGPQARRLGVRWHLTWRLSAEALGKRHGAGYVILSGYLFSGYLFFWLSIFLAVCLNGVPKAAETIPHDL